MISEPDSDVLGSLADLEEGAWRHKTIGAVRVTRIPSAQLHNPNLIRLAGGGLAWILQPPTDRRLGPGGVLDEFRPVAWEARAEGSDVVIEASQPAVMDLVLLGVRSGEAFLADDAEPLATPPVSMALGPARDLSQYVVGGAVLSPPFPWGSRMPSEQIALSIYRIARHRSGPFWDGLAAHIAEWVRERVSSPHGPLARREHMRLIADAALLLVAEAERTGGERHLVAAEAALDVLEHDSVPFGDGIWFRHDGEEADASRNDLVLATHLQAILALLAAGRDPQPGLRALERVLTIRPPARALVWAMGLSLGDSARRLKGPVRRAGEALVDSSLRRAGRAQSGEDWLRLPGGRLLRDRLPDPELMHYFSVGLSDLAGVARNLQSPTVQRALMDGVRFARASGYFAAQRRAHDPLCALVPALLRNAGLDSAANAHARRLRRVGFPAAIGWPGYADSLWSRLVAGTP